MIHIVVTTCDKYAPIIPKFLQYFYRYWTLPHKMTLVGVTPDTLKRPISLRDRPIEAVYLGKDNGWAANLLRYLESAPDEPFMMMMDDHILCDTVNNDLIRAAREIIALPDVGCVRLVPWPGPTLPYIHGDDFNHETDDFGEIDKALEYAISLQASFWKPQTMFDLLDPSWSPWDIEVNGSQRAATYKKKFIGSKTCAMSYKDYYLRGTPRPDHSDWVDEHLLD